MFAMTSTPMLCLNYITESNLWGFAKNPYNHERTTGGSSGGSAGFIATKCAPISVGIYLYLLLI